MNVRPGIVFALLLRRAITMRVWDRRQLTGNESEQHEGGNTAAEHTISNVRDAPLRVRDIQFRDNDTAGGKILPILRPLPNNPLSVSVHLK